MVRMGSNLGSAASRSTLDDSVKSRLTKNAPCESIRDHLEHWQSFLSIRRAEAQSRNGSAFRLRHSQALASRRQRLSQPMVRSTIHRLGRTTNLCRSERLTI